MLIKSKPHYQQFLKEALKLLCEAPLEQQQTKDFLMQSFKYYYLFHNDQSLNASQIVICAMRKLIPAVRFAVSDEFLLFFTIVKKLGKDLFLNFLKEKFDWAA